MANWFERKARQVGTSTLAFVPGPVGKPYRAEVRRQHGEFVNNGPGGSGRGARIVRSGVTLFGPPETNTEAVLNIAGGGITAGVSKGAVAFGVRRGDDVMAAGSVFGRLFGRTAARQPDEPVTFLAETYTKRGINSTTADAGTRALRQTARQAPTPPLSGRTGLTPGQRTALTVGGVGLGAAYVLPQIGQGINAGTAGAGQAFPNILNPLAEGLANTLAGIGVGTGAGIGAGVAGSLQGTAAGLKAITGPVLLLGGAAVLALVLINKSGGAPTRRR